MRLILLFILILGFINPLFYGTRILLLIIPFIILNIKKTLKYFDINSFLLFVFSVFFLFIEYNNSIKPTMTFTGIIVETLLFPLLYVVGRYLFNEKDSKRKIYYLVALSVSISIIPIISILEQIYIYGFETGTRSLYLIWNRNELKSATVLGGCLVVITIFFSSIFYLNKSNRRLVIFMILFSFLNALSFLRLGSRTMIGCVILSILLTLIQQRRSNLFKSLVILFCMITVIVFILNYLNFDVTLFYQDRMDSQNTSWESAGGRSGRWSEALDLMVEYPFGWDRSIIGYVHNFWLDIYRTSGVIPFSIILLISINFGSKLVTLIIEKSKMDSFLYYLITNFYLVIIILFMVEPIMDGFKLLFCFFIILNALIVEELRLLKKNNK